MDKILVINPGSTSTKIAVFEDELKLWEKNIEHSGQELAENETVDKQLILRKKAILSAMEENGTSVNELTAAVGRGGEPTVDLSAGGYIVNDVLREGLKKTRFHASNLGGLLAFEIASPKGLLSYIYDAVSSDELCDIARITGIPEIRRKSFCHVLNSKAMARKVASAKGGKYSGMNFVVAHLGGGVSVSAHEKGRIIDVITDDGGPFSPERSGSIPLNYIIDMCYGGQYDKTEMLRKIRGMGGIKAHLGVHDCREVERMIENGDEKARQVYEAFAYQISKGIGELSPTLSGKIDAIIITGGIAYSKMLTNWIKERVEFIAPVEIVPGENELESLALGALRILRGEETAKECAE